MGSAERRNEIFKYLCRVRYAKLSDLSQMFGVSQKTIARDIFEIEMTYHITLELRRGRYGGGVYMPYDYNFGQMYLYDEEIDLLIKLEQITKNMISEDDTALLSKMIKKYQRRAN